MRLNPGSRLGAYEVTGTLGAGGMGEVFRAHEATLNRDVVIKVLERKSFRRIFFVFREDVPTDQAAAAKRLG